MSKKPKTPKSIFTIGYERSRLDDFLAVLQDAGVKRVLDVRDVARSRRPEYSKGRLSAALAENGIDYQHLQALGVPKPGRDAIHAGRTKEFLDIYEARLATPEAEADLVRAIELGTGEPSCLLCYEADPAHCHRTIAAARITEVTGQHIEPLSVPARPTAKT